MPFYDSMSMKKLFLPPLLFCLLMGAISRAEDKPTGPKLEALKKATDRLKLPGVRIDPEEWCVDVESEVCLHDGLLEFIACTKDTKVHESIIAVKAAPRDIHTALLLLGAKPGSPAHQKAANDEKTRWISVPPSGHPIDVSLVVPGKDGKPREREIQEFISGREDPNDAANFEPLEPDGDAEPNQEDKFPTNTFLFAGSLLQDMRGDAKGPRTYLADMSGSVISISTFGDELLCLPGIHGHGNDTLRWSVNPTHLPKVGEKVILRLRPQREK